MVDCCPVQEEQTQFVYSESDAESAHNYMDRWIVSFTQSLVMFVRQEMQGHCYYSALAGLLYVSVTKTTDVT